MKQSPYGLFPGFYRTLAESSTRIMSDWMPNLDNDDRLRTFHAWRDRHVQKVSEFIWPRLDTTSMTWSGRAQDNADAVTKKELQLIQSEFQSSDGWVLDEKPDCPTQQANIPNHRRLYEIEDSTQRTKLIFVARDILSLYSPHIPETHLSIAQDAITKGRSRKVDGLFWFKGQYQRPRPHSSALCLSEYKYVSEIAYTGFHSSIISGHALIGAMMMCSVYEAWLDNGLSIDDAKHLVPLMQFGIDHGDRRVFAGVHYPSDNLASWALVLDLIPKLFNHPDLISDFLINAISKRSAVFRLIHTQYRQSEDLQPIIEYLDTEILKSSDSSFV